MTNAKSAERRLYKRFETDSAVDVVTEDGSAHRARAMNISLAGMQIRCDRDAVQAIAPKGEKTTPDQSPIARVRFSLPRNGDESEIETDVRVVLIRRVSEREYHVHMQYEFFQGNGYNELEEFIDKLNESSPQ